MIAQLTIDWTLCAVPMVSMWMSQDCSIPCACPSMFRRMMNSTPISECVAWISYVPLSLPAPTATLVVPSRWTQIPIIWIIPTCTDRMTRLPDNCVRSKTINWTPMLVVVATRTRPFFHPILKRQLAAPYLRTSLVPNLRGMLNASLQVLKRSERMWFSNSIFNYQKVIVELISIPIWWSLTPSS